MELSKTRKTLGKGKYLLFVSAQRHLMIHNNHPLLVAGCITIQISSKSIETTF